MVAQIALYEEMITLSAQMVDAAGSADWDRLAKLEQSLAALRDTLMAGGDDASLSAEDLAKKEQLIRRILDDDAKVRHHVEPWLEEIRHALGDAAVKRRVDQAYGIEEG